jgi:hypothetical protein
MAFLWLAMDTRKGQASVEKPEKASEGYGTARCTWRSNYYAEERRSI